MKKMAALPLLIILGSCSLVNPKWTYTTTTPDLTGISNIEIAANNGLISVQRDINSSAKLVLGTQNTTHNAKVERVGNTLRISEPSSFMCWDCNISVELTVPAALETSISTANGNIKGVGISPLKANTTNGEIEISDVSGAVSATSTNGSIRTSNTTGTLQLKTTNGSVTSTNAVLPSGSSNKISTTNGSINANNVSTLGGFVLQGSTNIGGVSFGLSGFDVQKGNNWFTATRSGNSPTQIRFESNNGGIVVQP